MHAIADSRSGAGRGGVRNRGKGSKEAQSKKYWANRGSSKGKGGDAGKGKQGKGHGDAGKGKGKQGKSHVKGCGNDKGSQPVGREDRALDANLN
jgi:hypothetical protein